MYLKWLLCCAYPKNNYFMLNLLNLSLCYLLHIPTCITTICIIHTNTCLSFFLNTLSLVMMMTGTEPKDNNLKGVKGGPKKAPRPRGNTPTMGSPLKKGKPPLTLILIQILMLNPKRVVKRGKKHFWPKKAKKCHKKVAVYFFHIHCCHVLKQSWAHYLCN